MNRILRFSTLFVGLILLAACASVNNNVLQDGPPKHDVDVSRISDAKPQYEPRSKYGNPPSYVVRGKRYHVMNSSHGYRERGIASWYGTKFHQHRTSSGEPYDMFKMTAASRTLPLPTYVRVTNLENGHRVIVKVNDRGPFEKNRVMDLSYAAAKKLGVTARGTAYVEVEALETNGHYSTGEVDVARMTRIPGHPILYLQIGAFSHYPNALNLHERAKQIVGKPMRIKTVTVNNQTIYKVQIGPVGSVALSDRITHRLEQAGMGEPMQVVE